ncbi:MAG: NAD(P)H:quinone oxidoreductase [Chloroflexota bacterium]|nr:NAD(P)H:quinone oxidoreductase [Chloroflexota bacterium]
MKVLILFYSRYGNTARLAEGIAAGVRKVEGAEVLMRKVNETAPAQVIANDPNWKLAHDEMAQKYNPPTLDDLEQSDAIVFGSPTRFGNMSAEMKLFLDTTGPLWIQGKLLSKVGAVFCTNSTLHSGKESTLLSMMIPLFHHGMIIVGVPQNVPETATAGSFYGATATCGTMGDNPPTAADIVVAEALGRRVAEVATQLKRG